MRVTHWSPWPGDGYSGICPARVRPDKGDERVPAGIPLRRVPKAPEFVCCDDERIVDYFCQLEVHSLFSIRRYGWVQRSSVSLKGGIRRVTQLGFACCFVSCLRFVLLSYVSQWRWREQRSWRHSELGVANRSEGDIMNKGWGCSWLAWLRYLSCLSCCVHVLSFVAWNMELDVVSDFMNMWYDWVVMANDENLGRNSDGIWV